VEEIETIQPISVRLIGGHDGNMRRMDFPSNGQLGCFTPHR